MWVFFVEDASFFSNFPVSPCKVNGKEIFYFLNFITFIMLKSCNCRCTDKHLKFSIVHIEKWKKLELKIIENVEILFSINFVICLGREILPAWDRQIQSLCYQVNNIMEKIATIAPEWMDKAMDEQMVH